MAPVISEKPNMIGTIYSLNWMNRCLVVEMDDTAAIFYCLRYTYYYCHVKDTYFWLHNTKPEQVF